MVRCPGQDQRYWKPDDIFEVKCAACGRPLEFFKDEPKLKCKNCGQLVPNPRIDLGCAEWCQYAEQCLGAAAAKDVDTVFKTDAGRKITAERGAATPARRAGQRDRKNRPIS
jgi:hypothetical protein